MITLKMTAHCSAEECDEAEEFDVNVGDLPFKVEYTENIGVTGVEGIDDGRIALPEGWQRMNEYGDEFSTWNYKIFCPACIPAKVEAQKAAVKELERRVEEWRRGKKRR